MASVPPLRIPDVLQRSRFEKTIAKTRRGGLPAPTKAANFLPGTGKACDGCGDAVSKKETLYSVDVSVVVQLSFHHECHVAWTTYSGQSQHVCEGFVLDNA